MEFWFLLLDDDGEFTYPVLKAFFIIPFYVALCIPLYLCELYVYCIIPLFLLSVIGNVLLYDKELSTKAWSKLGKWAGAIPFYRIIVDSKVAFYNNPAM